MKKILSLILIIVFILTSAAYAMEFIDVDDSYSWATDAIKELSEKKIIDGYPDGTFKPQNNITNAETAKITVLLFGESENAEYNDVAEDKWYYSYVKKAKNYFLRAENDFYPDENTLRKEIAYALYVGAGFDKIDESLSVDKKYEAAVSYLNEIGVLKGYPDGTLGEEKEVTRAEFATLIKRVNDIKNVPQTEEEEKTQTNVSGYERPHSFFYVVTDVATAIGDSGEPQQKICGYINGEYEENFIPETAEVKNINSIEDKIDKNDILYIFKDYYGKIKYVTILDNADNLNNNSNPYDYFKIQLSKNNKYILGKVKSVRNGNVVEIIKDNENDLTEGYRVKDDASIYIFADEKISLSKITKIREDRIKGKGDFVFTFMIDDEITDVLIIRENDKNN